MRILPLVKMSGAQLPSLRSEFKGPLDDLFNSVFDEVFGSVHGIQSINSRRTYPKMDVYRRHEDLVIEAFVPGIKKEDILVHLEGNVLSISSLGQSLNVGTPEVVYYIKELKKSSFVRQIEIPKNINTSNIEEAELSNGILTVVFRDAFVKEATPELKTIPIK